jgi:septal ring factor EnvC (AmiA/AmiB activator)
MIEQFAPAVPVVAAILGAAAWLHNSLGALRTEIRVIQAQLSGYDRRLDEIERDIRELQKEVHK